MSILIVLVVWVVVLTISLLVIRWFKLRAPDKETDQVMRKIIETKNKGKNYNVK